MDKISTASSPASLHPVLWIAGAVGGGLLGNSIEKSRGRTTSYEVALRMDDGSTRTIASDTMPSWRIGDKVKLIGGAIVSR